MNCLSDNIQPILSFQQAGKIHADSQVGRFLNDLVANVPKMEPEQFEEMLNNNMKVKQ